MGAFCKTMAGAMISLLIQMAPAEAQFLTFVSAIGNDGSNCRAQATPCKTLQRAIDVTSPGGEVRVLTRLTGGGTVNKSMTINGGGNTVIGAIAVNSAGAAVTLRALTLNGRHAIATGIRILNAAAVHIEDSTIERFTGDGIQLLNAAAIEVDISGSVLRDNGGRGMVASSPPAFRKLTIDNCRFDNNKEGLVLGEYSTTTVSQSAFSGNSDWAVFVGPNAEVDISHTSAVGNRVGFVVSGGLMTLRSSVARGHTTDAGLFVGRDGGFAPNGFAFISDSVFTNNKFGIYVDQSSSVNTSGDNILAGNSFADVVETRGGTVGPGPRY